MVPVAAMDEHPADNKTTTAPHGSPTPAPVEKQQQQQHHPPQRQPSPKMQSAPPLPPVQQQQHQHHQHPQHQHPQYYAAPNGQQLPSSDYRGSPPGAVPMSLPSIQHFEGANMQSQPQYLPPAHMNGAPSMIHAQAYNSNMVQYQQPMPPTMPSNAPNGHNGMMRYPIPPQAPMEAWRPAQLLLNPQMYDKAYSRPCDLRNEVAAECMCRQHLGKVGTHWTGESIMSD
jgi:hypothetical protein